MKLKEWQHMIDKMQELRTRFDKAGAEGKREGLETFPVNLNSEECFILCHVLSTTAMEYNRGDYEFKGYKYE